MQNFLYNNCNFSMTPGVHPLVGRSVGWSVGRLLFLKGWKVTLPCSYLSRLVRKGVTAAYRARSLRHPTTNLKQQL